jgi:hypothetical protein
MATADSLRAPGGKLATSGGGLLPPTNDEGFIAGDIRANENVGLTSTHALFVREHNRLAVRIKDYDGDLSDDEVYQWARKIVGAEMQAITYREFLPALMGAEDAPSPDDYAYDDFLDASITTAFSTAAFRYGHSMQSSQLLLVNDAGVVEELSLATATENPEFLVENPARVELILKGLATQTAQENDALLVDELRNIPFGPPGSGGTDLAAVDIQRGRDHALLNSYRLMRQSYSLPQFNEFSELTSDVQLQVALASVYGEVENLDGWVAMIAEDHVAGSSLGMLAQTIIRSQFTRLRDGDRFFFTGDPDLETELVAAVVDLDSITLSQVITLNTGITKLQENVFFVAKAVPEPGTTALALLAMLGLMRPRSARRDRFAKPTTF